MSSVVDALRAVIYTRVSSDPRNKGRSVGEQEAECRLVAGDHRWRVVEVFSDNDRSASRYASKARPAFAELVEFLRAGKADVLVCWEFSRATRDLGTYVALRDLCLEHGVLLSYGDSVYDMTKARDRRASAQDAVDAENESGKTSERVQRSMRSAAIKGRPHGRPLYGYRRVYDRATGDLLAVEVDEEQASVLGEAALRVLSGESCRQIARDFQLRGLPAPHGDLWHATNVPRLLRNPAYVAQRIHRGKVLGQADWPPLFDELTWTRLQAKLADPTRLTRQGDSSATHLLTGIATCGVCGGRVGSTKTTGTTDPSRRSLTCIGRLGVTDGLNRPGMSGDLLA
jgi:site-specific DNA recombinase